jgi:hypothetical protein
MLIVPLDFHPMKKLRHLLAMAVPVWLGIVCSTDAAAQDVVVVRAQPREIWLAPQGINHPAVDFAACTKAARNHVLLLERDCELRPDQAIFQSLQINPTHSMPDSAQDTLTSLVNFYFTRAVEALRGEK